MPSTRKTPALLAAAGTIALALGLTVALGGRAQSGPAAAGPKLAHMVFFTLTDRSAEARAKLVAACEKYLSGHEGATFFAVGTIAEDVVEGPSVRDFDVALHLVFENKEAEARYIKAPRHVQFVEENKASFAKVRVFDSYLGKP